MAGIINNTYQANGKRKRLLWVDAVKGIAIIAVVLLHSDYTFYDSEWLPLWSLLGNSWHVSVFFIMSGFFINPDESMGACIRNNFKNLYLKLIVIYLLAVGLHNLMIDGGLYELGREYGGKLMQPYSLALMVKKALLAAVGAGREPILSPLWFVYVLFVARITLNSIFSLTNRLFHTCRYQELVRTLLLLALCIAGHVLSNVADIQIPRYGNLFSVVWLIYVGYYLYRVRRVQFTNPWWALAGFAAYYLCTIVFGPNILMTNTYHNVASLTLCSTGALYALCYVAKWCEHKAPATVGIVAAIGKRSFWIMALHLAAFKAATLGFAILGIDYPLADLNSPATPHLWVLFAYTAIGVALPALLANLLSRKWRFH